MADEGRTYVFLGTPRAAAIVLEQLVANGISISHVVTRPDAKRGRGSALSPSPVKDVAVRLGLEVSHDLDWIRKNASRGLVGLVVAYGRIIPADLLEVVPMINIHFSLLPRWRGAAPVERALLAGDDRTGVCVMKIEPTLDTGPVYSRREVAINEYSTTASLTDELALAGAQELLECLNKPLPVPEPQSGEVTHAAKVTRDELRINWNDSAVAIHRQIRAVRAHTHIDGSRLRLASASVAIDQWAGPPGTLSPSGLVATGDGTLALTRVQPEGRSEMDVDAWLRGRPAGCSWIFD